MPTRAATFRVNEPAPLATVTPHPALYVCTNFKVYVFDIRDVLQFSIHSLGCRPRMITRACCMLHLVRIPTNSFSPVWINLIRNYYRYAALQLPCLDACGFHRLDACVKERTGSDLRKLATIPNSTAIFLFREPVERLVSFHNDIRSGGHKGETIDNCEYQPGAHAFGVAALKYSVCLIIILESPKNHM